MYPTLETKRLLLNPLQENDFEDMFELFSNSAVTVTMVGMEGKTMSLTAFRKWFSDVIKIDSFYTIRCKKTNSFFGYCQIHLCIKQNKVSHSQMNIALLPNFWGKGYATEATQKLLNFAFLGIRTPWVCANQFPDNLVAGSVLKKCGLRFYKTFKMQNRLHNQYRYTIDEYLTDNNLPLEKESDYVFSIKKSLYSYDIPIRKIDSIKFIKQPTEYLCGQSVIAMLADVTVDEVVDVMQTDKGTSTRKATALATMIITLPLVLPVLSSALQTKIPTCISSVAKSPKKPLILISDKNFSVTTTRWGATSDCGSIAKKRAQRT